MSLHEHKGVACSMLWAPDNSNERMNLHCIYREVHNTHVNPGKPLMTGQGKANKLCTCMHCISSKLFIINWLLPIMAYMSYMGRPHPGRGTF